MSTAFDPEEVIEGLDDVERMVAMGLLASLHVATVMSGQPMGIGFEAAFNNLHENINEAQDWPVSDFQRLINHLVEHDTLEQNNDSFTITEKGFMLGMLFYISDQISAGDNTVHMKVKRVDSIEELIAEVSEHDPDAAAQLMGELDVTRH